MEPRINEVTVLGHSGFRRLAYAEWGPEKAEQTVLCLHGVSRTGRDFDVLASALAAEGARVIAPDLPGRGRSDCLAKAVHYTDRAYTGALSTLIARLDVEAVDWIGTSLGGHIIYLDVVLWQLWEKIDCPVLILRGEDSDLLSEATTRDMLNRGPAAKAGMVTVVEVPECGHAPALMEATQIATIKEFLFSGRPRAGGRARPRSQCALHVQLP